MILISASFGWSYPCWTSQITLESDQESPISKGHLQLNKPFVIQYTTRLQTFRDASAIQALIYFNPLDPPKKVDMKKKIDNMWEATIILTDSSVKMIMCAFQAKDSTGLRSDMQTDENKGEFWDILVHDETGKPVQGAYQARTLSYTGSGGKRAENLDKAIEEIKQEISLYPDNYPARTLYYSVLLRKNEYSDHIRDQIENQIDNFAQNHPSDESVLNFAVGGYRMIGDTDKAKKIESQLIRMNPKGEQASMKTFDEIMKLEDAGSRVQKLENFLKDFPSSRMTEIALSTLATAVIELDDSTKMIQTGDRLLNESTAPAGASGLAGLAAALSEKRFQLGRAQAYIEKAIGIIISSGMNIKPPEISVEEWKEQIRTTESRYRDILGWVYFQQGNTQQSLTELRNAVEGSPQPITYYHLAQALEKEGLNDEALLNYARVLGHEGELADTSREKLSALWTRMQKNPADLDAFIAKQVATIEEEYKTKILSKRKYLPAPDFELEDFSGGWVRLSDQKGSVVLLCFWATWSESSRFLLRELGKLAEILGQDALFLTIAMDVNVRTIDQFIRKNKVQFPVLFNENTDRDYELRGVPTLFVIDDKGIVNFEHRGFSPDILNILRIEIEALLKK